MTEQITFGTDGWRAVIADQFTFANVERVAHAVGLYVLKNYPKAANRGLPLLLGYDTRFLANRFAYRAGQVLSGLGVASKIAQRDVPTPCIAFAAQHEATAGALQFTASHNPPEYLGVKYIPDYAGPATNEITETITGYLGGSSSHLVEESTTIPEFDPKPPYLEALGKIIDLKRIAASGIKPGFDALYSTSRDYLDLVLSQAGVKVEVIHNWRDANFGGGMPEPKAQYLADLFTLVKSAKLDVGLATDGDADRFAVIDELGNYLSPNQLLCLLMRHLVKNHSRQGAIVRTVATTHMLDRLAGKYKLEVLETPVGFKYIGEIMRAKNVLIGGEESGGVSIQGHIPEKDGILANLLVLEMLAYEKKPLSKIWQDVVQEAGGALAYRRADLKLSILTQSALMERLKQSPLKKLAGQTVTKVSLVDGLKVYLAADSWLLIRPSGTEPLLRLYSESAEPELADAMLADAKVSVESIVKDLGSLDSGSAQKLVASGVKLPGVTPAAED
ncbi:MAG: phosphoglucosamine mutase [Candidatus Melainabacteria bacterium]|nr:MAG: phosphoglucosamine mutase [Candidatus Melainabacteria bacterium]